MADESGQEASTGVDPAALLRLRTALREQGDAVVAQLIGLFIEEATKRLATIDHGMRADDAPAVQLCAHALRGSAELLGARRLGHLSERLERAAGEGQLQAAEALLADLHDEYARVERQLKESA
jgi:HPt (histidine-containing phosphotransfer) domain-containing protein